MNEPERPNAKGVNKRSFKPTQYNHRSAEVRHDERTGRQHALTAGVLRNIELIPCATEMLVVSPPACVRLCGLPGNAPQAGGAPRERRSILSTRQQERTSTRRYCQSRKPERTNKKKRTESSILFNHRSRSSGVDCCCCSSSAAVGRQLSWKKKRLYIT